MTTIFYDAIDRAAGESETFRDEQSAIDWCKPRVDPDDASAVGVVYRRVSRGSTSTMQCWPTRDGGYRMNEVH